MKLYGALLSPYVARVLLAVRFKGLDIPLVPAPGVGLKSPEYLAINPYGKMPALETDGTAIIESEVICEFLDERFPERKILPGDDLARARARIISRAADLYILPALLGLLGQMNPVSRDARLVAEKMAELKRGRDGLETFIDGPWCMGTGFTLADCAMVPACFFLEKFLPAFGGLDVFADHPRMGAVWRHAQNDPMVADLLKQMNGALDDFMRRRAANG
ncbi:glutathione S-transferase family protein [Niveispirillum fermenti]|uniref:glutathione S-transferase family protein n=1 Tax=Niveispirillum fermenti TaxID=1233113 RepID=UPI003A8803D7